jgi:predicted lipase
MANKTILGIAVQDPKTKARGIVVYSQPLNSIFVTFAGTTTINGWVENFKVWLSNADWNDDFTKKLRKPQHASLMKLHAGIEASYVSIREEIMAKANEFATAFESAAVVFSGHSLGGALAVLAAVDFNDKFDHDDRISVYSFGQPRLGNKRWAEYVNGLGFSDRIYRIRRRGDPFGHLPTRNFFGLGYQHTLTPYIILENDDIVKCKVIEGTGEESQCLEDWGKLDIKLHRAEFGYWKLGKNC